MEIYFTSLHYMQYLNAQRVNQKVSNCHPRSETMCLKVEQWYLTTWNHGENSPGIHSSFSLKHLEKTTIQASLLPQHVKYISLSEEAGGWPYTHRDVCCVRKGPCLVQREAETKNSEAGQKRRGKTSFCSF